MPQKSALLIYFAAEVWNHPAGTYILYIYICLLYKLWRRDDVIIMATRLLHGRSEVRVLAGQSCSSLLRKVQTLSGAHPSILLIIVFWGVQRPLHKIDHSLSSNAEVKNEWSYTSEAPRFCHSLHRDKFTFTRFQTSATTLWTSGACVTLRGANWSQYTTFRFQAELK